MQSVHQAATALKLLGLDLCAQLTLAAPTVAPGTSPNPAHDVKKREYYLNCSFGMIYICEERGTICLNDEYPWSPDRWCAANCECIHVHDCCTVAGPGEGEGHEGGNLEHGKEVDMVEEAEAAEAK
jgi:hypothetical protein